MAKTVQELQLGFDRIEAAQACRNLMGKYSYFHTAMRNKEYVTLWADRDDDLLVMPWGYYKGIEGVRACYLQDHGDRSDLPHPQGRHDDALHGHRGAGGGRRRQNSQGLLDVPRARELLHPGL